MSRRLIIVQTLAMAMTVSSPPSRTCPRAKRPPATPANMNARNPIETGAGCLPCMSAVWQAYGDAGTITSGGSSAGRASVSNLGLSMR